MMIVMGGVTGSGEKRSVGLCWCCNHPECESDHDTATNSAAILVPRIFLNFWSCHGKHAVTPLCCGNRPELLVGVDGFSIMLFESFL